MRELHHRVKNNLQVISSMLALQSMKLENETARIAITEGKDRIRAMSLIHQRLYKKENELKINVREYVKNLMNDLVDSYGDHRNVDINLSIDSYSLNADTTLPIGLIINELVTNAFKYAFEKTDLPQIVVDLKVKNNGKNSNNQSI